MKIKPSTTVMIVGHGSSSGKKTTIDYGNHTLIFPLPVGETFWLSTHNLLVKPLISTSSKGNEMRDALELVASLPTTITVNRSYYKDIKLTLGPSVSTAQTRLAVQQQLSDAERESMHSQKAWEALEYKIAPADDLLNSRLAVLPSKTNSDFQMFQLLYKEFIENTRNITLNIHLDKKVVFNQIDSEPQNHEQKLSADNFLYITPYAKHGAKEILYLSHILGAIDAIHILAAKHDAPQSTESTKKAKVGTHSIVMVYLDPFKSHTEFIQNKTDFESRNTHTEWYDFSLPDNCNILMGACSTQDSSF